MTPRCPLFRASLLLFTFGFTAGQDDSEREPLTVDCLECLCEMVTGCNTTFKCDDKGVCGTFRITKPFWIDADKPVHVGEDVEDADAYAKCVIDPACAAQTVTNYMDKLASDCNGDSKIDCYDYAAMHKLGAWGCTGGLKADDRFFQRFDRCMKVIGDKPPLPPSPPISNPEFSEKSYEFSHQLQHHNANLNKPENNPENPENNAVKPENNPENPKNNPENPENNPEKPDDPKNPPTSTMYPNENNYTYPEDKWIWP